MGQRKGIGIPSNTDRKSYVVVAKTSTPMNYYRFRLSRSTHLYSAEAELVEINWINKPICQPRKIFAGWLPRPLVEAIIKPLPTGAPKLSFAPHKGLSYRARYGDSRHALLSWAVVLSMIAIKD
ncbi:MAG: hypothetical protein ACLUKN_09040 [Bacilli bacterium]